MSSTIRSVLLLSLASIAFLAVPRLSAAGYIFVEGYNVLDTNNAPVFATGDIGTNFAATAGQERDIAVDSARGIIYIARGLGTVSDGRVGVGAAISCIVVTNGARAGSNFRDTGVMAPASGQPALGFCQSLAYDRDSDKLWVFGGTAATTTPNIMSVPGGTLGGAPDGDAINAINAALVREFQADNSLARGGAQRGFAVRTVDGVTTVFLGMGSHVQAWRNDQSTNGTGTNSLWRRIWATLAPPTQNTVATRLASTASAVNGIAVDDAGNCYFNVAGTTPARIWTVRPEIVESATDPLSLDFNDTYFGGTNNREILPLILIGSPTATDTNNPQGITFCRFGAQKTLFVSFLTSLATTRGVTRLEIDDALSSTNGIQYLRAVVADGFGSGQPAGGQDSILSTMRLKQAGVTQPSGAANALLFHDVDSVTNPTYLYVDAFVIDTNKGQTVPTAAIMKVQIPADTNPPSIIVQPLSQTLLEGGTIDLSVGATGLKPLFYQWQSNSVDIPGATNSRFRIAPASTNGSALYRVTISNTLGSITSTQVQVTVNPLVRSTAMTPLWSNAPGSRVYLSTDDRQRGLTFNPELHTLLVVSRTPNNGIYSLNPNTGADNNAFQLGPLVTGGTFALNMIAASDEGHIYAANLAENGQEFRIYYWDLETYDIDAAVAYAGLPAAAPNRWGDTLNVRGAGNEIQLIAASRRSNVVAIFTTIDGGFTLTPTIVSVPDAPNGAFGLGVAFGRGNTFWGKGDQGTALRMVEFDLAQGTGTVVRTYGSPAYPGSAIPIGVETSLNILAAISIENPDNLRLYDISDLASGPRLVDQELFPTDNENINATGAIDFGDGKVFALDSNNGIIALTLGAIPPPPNPPGRIDIARVGNAVTLTWTNIFTLQSATNVTGPYIDVNGAVSGYSESTDSAAQKFFRIRN
jgi:hypothetical protein